jgi:hypothetical protein
MPGMRLHDIKSHPPRTNAQWAALAHTLRETTPSKHETVKIVGNNFDWLSWVMRKMKMTTDHVPGDHEHPCEESALALWHHGFESSTLHRLSHAQVALEAGAGRLFMKLWDKLDTRERDVLGRRCRGLGFVPESHRTTPQELPLTAGEGLWFAAARTGRLSALTLMKNLGLADISTVDAHGHTCASHLRHAHAFRHLHAMGLDPLSRTPGGRSVVQLWVEQAQESSDFASLIKAWHQVLPSDAALGEVTELLCSRASVLPPAAITPLLTTPGLPMSGYCAEPQGLPLAWWAMHPPASPPVLAGTVKLRFLPEIAHDTLRRSDLSRAIPEEGGRSMLFVALFEPGVSDDWRRAAQGRWEECPEARMDVPAQWQALQSWMNHRSFPDATRSHLEARWIWMQQELNGRAFSHWLVTPEPSTGEMPLVGSPKQPWSTVMGSFARLMASKDHRPILSSVGMEQAQVQRQRAMSYLGSNPNSPGAAVWMALILRDRLVAHGYRSYDDASFTPEGLLRWTVYRNESEPDIRESRFLDACAQAGVHPHPLLLPYLEHDDAQELLRACRQRQTEGAEVWHNWCTRWSLQHAATNPATRAPPRLRL